MLPLVYSQSVFSFLENAEAPLILVHHGSMWRKRNSETQKSWLITSAGNSWAEERAQGSTVVSGAIILTDTHNQEGSALFWVGLQQRLLRMETASQDYGAFGAVSHTQYRHRWWRGSVSAFWCSYVKAKGLQEKTDFGFWILLFFQEPLLRCWASAESTAPSQPQAPDKDMKCPLSHWATTCCRLRRF